MKTVVGISLGAGDQDFAFTHPVHGAPLQRPAPGHQRQHRQGGQAAEALAEHADAIGLGVVKDSYTVGSRRYVEKDSARMKGAVTRVPVTTGGRLGDILQEWALRHVQIKLGDYFNNAKVLFFSGRTNYKLALAMSEYTQNLQFADPLLQLGVPKLLTSLDIARALHQRRALRARLDAGRADGVGPGPGVDEVHAAQGDAGRDRRSWRRSTSSTHFGAEELARQDHHHLDGQRPAHRAFPGQGRPHGGRRLPRCCSTTCWARACSTR